MRGSVFAQCWCRDPETKRLLHRRCPKLGKKGHGSWWFRYDAPPGPGGKRRQPEVGPFPTKKAAEGALADELSTASHGGPALDRSLKVGPYLDAWVAGKVNLKPSSLATAREAVQLYWKPALGHLRLVDLRDHHVAEAVREMGKINQPAPDDGKPSEMLRRMLAARADDERRVLPPGEKRRKKSTKPLSPKRIERMFAVLRAAMNAAVPRKLTVNPCEGVEMPRAPKVQPVPWTPGREKAFWVAFGQREKDAGRKLTTVERQRLWATVPRPSKVMVWLPAHTGQFLDAIEGERLYALFHLTAFAGLRRAEAAGLTWAEVDLDEGVAYVRETRTDDSDGPEDPKTGPGVRVVPLPPGTVAALKAWRKRQNSERLAFGPDWADTGLVFTREDGTAVPPQWISVRFATLAYRAGLPPVRFHDLRHGAASLCKAAGLDTKFISALLGHSRTNFTDATYVLVFPAVAKDAAKAAENVVPRAKRHGG
jgi:integrase